MYYDKLGNKIDVNTRMQLQKEKDYRNVSIHQIKNYIISTVWLGLEHGENEKGQPLIFETIVFFNRETEEQYRFASLEEAQHAHQGIVERYKALSNQL